VNGRRDLSERSSRQSGGEHRIHDETWPDIGTSCLVSSTPFHIRGFEKAVRGRRSTYFVRSRHLSLAKGLAMVLRTPLKSGAVTGLAVPFALCPADPVHIT
jgi:hypothetical protein